MPSFDVVVKADHQEIKNAVEQAAKEVATRYDFRDSDIRIELAEGEQVIRIEAKEEFYVHTAADVVTSKLVRRKVDPLFFDQGEPEVSPSGKARLDFRLQEGIPQELAKKITRMIKDSKLKVQPAIRGDELRVTGKKRDDLQEAISLLKGEGYDRPLSFINFRD